MLNAGFCAVKIEAGALTARVYGMSNQQTAGELYLHHGDHVVMLVNCICTTVVHV